MIGDVNARTVMLPIANLLSKNINNFFFYFDEVLRKIKIIFPIIPENWNNKICRMKF